ncbi:hypothetical protein LEP1GSC024_3295 [Leptospira noguchii str. 2001034031]|uniref:Uncharacterized protein n=1 Tax=Leptospira noguchii str. 2001034031 TaxID=1193053 RepID=M6Y2R5_9LEPT|nr:hypothetical protein LEP1GSC024_3295 [Leptospira noguchii str. 2001034031]
MLIDIIQHDKFLDNLLYNSQLNVFLRESENYISFSLWEFPQTMSYS